jgi:hypothetical protein
MTLNLEWAKAIKIGRSWLEQPECEVKYIDPLYGAVLYYKGCTLSVRLSDRWACIEIEGPSSSA